MNTCPHQELRAAAKLFGFHEGLVKCACMLYRQWWRIVMNGAVSAEVVANGTVVAGCSLATTLSKLLVMAGLRRAREVAPMVTIRNLVDDFSLQVVATFRLAAAQLNLAVGALLSFFKEGGLPVSWNKSGFLANSDELALELSSSTTFDGLKRLRTARDLGGDLTDGLRRHVVEAVKRADEAQRRSRRLQSLREAGAETRSVHRAGPTASAIWGQAVTGIPDSRLHSLRVSAAKAEGKLPKGSSLGFRLRCSHREALRGPLLINTKQVVLAWAEAIWED